jgi:exodeoxyribonuclease VIII
MLKAYLECPQRYHAGEEFKRTPAIVLGSLVHTLVLEPHKFEAQYAIEPKCDTRSKAGKTLAEQLEKTRGNREGIDEEQLKTAKAIVASLEMHSEASALLNLRGIEKEISGFYLDDESGLMCKYRPDARTDSVVLDVKTTSDASAEGFSKSIVNYGYHISAAHYLAGESIARSCHHSRFILIAVETTAPYPVAVYQLSERAIEEGMNVRREALNRLATSIKTNYWPSYNDGFAVEIDLPRWAYKKEDFYA